MSAFTNGFVVPPCFEDRLVDLLYDVLVGVGEACGRGQVDGVGWGPKPGFHPVELETRGPVVHHEGREVPDKLVIPDALENEGGPRVLGCRVPGGTGR